MYAVDVYGVNIYIFMIYLLLLFDFGLVSFSVSGGVRVDTVEKSATLSSGVVPPRWYGVGGVRTFKLDRLACMSRLFPVERRKRPIFTITKNQYMWSRRSTDRRKFMKGQETIPSSARATGASIQTDRRMWMVTYIRK